MGLHTETLEKLPSPSDHGINRVGEVLFSGVNEGVNDAVGDLIGWQRIGECRVEDREFRICGEAI